MKKSKNRSLAVALCGVISLGLAQNDRADFIVNGNFTSTTSPLVSGGPGQMGFNNNATGWSTTGYNFLFAPGLADNGTGVSGQYGVLQLWGSNNGGVDTLTPPPDGGNFVAADGAFSTEPITQTITGLTIGNTYAVTFEWAAAQQSGYYTATSDSWLVSLGGGASQNTGMVDIPAKGFSGWIGETFDYTASNTSEVLSFLAAGAPTGQPPFALLSNVSMVDLTPVPEPSQIMGGLFIVAIAGSFAMRKLLKKKETGAEA